MKIGAMRHVIRFQKPSTTVNAAGTAVDTWLPFAMLRAERLEAAIAETVSDSGAEDHETVRFRTRYISKITADMRLSFGDVHFNIKRLQPLGNNQFLEIEAVKAGA